MSRRARWRCAALAMVAALAAPAGCGAGSRGAAAERPELTVAAAASLSGPFDRLARGFRPARVRLSLAGSDELAAQIRRGARPDVFAAADSELPKALAREGLAEAPTTFAVNRLVLAVPAGSAIDSLADLEAPGRRLVVGSASVPVGRLTRAVLARLGPERSRRILAAVRSEEPDVRGVAAKVAGGAADAGFVYRTDVRAAGTRLQAIELPERLRPNAVYAAAVMRGAPEPRLARRFVVELRSDAGARALREAGFGPTPVRP